MDLENAPIQIDPVHYVRALEDEVSRLHGENIQLRAAVHHLQAQPPHYEGVPCDHPKSAEADG